MKLLKLSKINRNGSVNKGELFMQRIIPHLWFDKEASEASEFYMSLFQDSELKDKVILSDTPSGTVEIITVELAGQEFMLLSAGPYFKFTPSVSFLVACQTVDEVERLWGMLIEGGHELMPLGSYPFSEKYAWVADRFGLSWQLMFMGDHHDIVQKITPTLMFVGDQCGNCEVALRFYTSVFRDSEVSDILRYGDDSKPDKPGTIQHAEFTLDKQHFAAMDSAYEHGFTFNEAISFLVNCDSQEEIDYFWGKLSAVPEAEQCGWLKDKYGFSWQITPRNMNELMKVDDPDKMARMTAAMLEMKKLNVNELENA
jgi:predicted 3-demethylubiquinone-9 3-methyltransferase (glyoxalase superfamily)